MSEYTKASMLLVGLVAGFASGEKELKKECEK